jgi:hypothetical protein
MNACSGAEENLAFAEKYACDQKPASLGIPRLVGFFA